MIAIIFALIAATGWGIADIFGGLVARKIGGYSSAFWSFITCLILASIYIPFTINELGGISIQTIIWLLLLTPIGVIPIVSLYQGFKVGNASLVGTIAGANGGLVVVFSVIFLGEILTIFQIFSITAILLGLVLSSIDFKSTNIKELLSDKGVPYALVSLVTWGIFYTFIKIPIDNVGWFWPSYIPLLGFPLVLMYMKIQSIKLEIPKGKKTLLYVLFNGLAGTTALFAFNFALEHGQNSVVSPLSSSYPALFALIAYFVFKDRLTKQQILGIVITLAGVISLSLVS